MVACHTIYSQPAKVTILPRDLGILQLLDRTPVTTAQLLKASVIFPGEPFKEERRVRERLQTLASQKLIHSYSLAVSGGGLANYYRLTAEGFRTVHGSQVSLPHRSTFAELPPSRLQHTLGLADLIVHLLVAAHAYRLPLTSFHGENQLVLESGSQRVVPDCHMQFTSGGRVFNLLIELDRSTEPLDSQSLHSLRTKLLAYEAYQTEVINIWKQNGANGHRPYFRVVFLTLGVERTNHILALARLCARNPDRRLAYAAVLETVLAEADALRLPLFLDHHGHWQALVNLQPTTHYLRTPVRIAKLNQPTLGIW